MEETNYGIKKKGVSGFIIVAPHAAGDDLGTEELAQSIAEQLKASLVVNKNYVKPTNSKAGIKPVRDFNKLSIRNEKYVWGNDIASRHMKEFYDDISEFMRNIISKPKYERAIIVFIHGMKDGKNKIDIDIGCGVKYHKGRLEGAKNHPDAGTNTGVFTANREYIENLKEALSKLGFRIGIGEAERCDKNGKKIQFVAWDRRNGIQYFTKTKSQSFQLEIAAKLRKRDKLGYTSKVIAQGLVSAYKE